MTDKNLRSASIVSDSDSGVLSVDSRETIPDCAVNLRYKSRITNEPTNYEVSKSNTYIFLHFSSHFYEKNEKYLDFVLTLR